MSSTANESTRVSSEQCIQAVLVTRGTCVNRSGPRYSKRFDGDIAAETASQPPTASKPGQPRLNSCNRHYHVTTHAVIYGAAVSGWRYPLRELDLSHNAIGEAGARALAHFVTVSID